MASMTEIRTDTGSARAWIAATTIALAGVATSAAAVEVLHVPRDFATIQAAVDAAAPGDVVQVARGTYIENVVVNGLLGKNGIRLHGQNATLDGTVIGGIGIHLLHASDVTVQGFTVHSYEAGIVLQGTASSRVHRNTSRDHDSPDPGLRDGIQLVDSHGNAVTNNRSHGNGHNGITLKGASTGNVIQGNRADGNGTNPAVVASAGGCGIQLIGSGNDDNAISENRTDGNGWGIQMSDSTGNVVRQNRGQRNKRAAVVVLHPGAGNFLAQNHARGNGTADLPPSFDFDLFDQGALDNTWERNRGTANF